MRMVRSMGMGGAVTCTWVRRRMRLGVYTGHFDL